MSSINQLETALPGPQTGTVFDVVRRFWKLILAVFFVVTISILWSATRPKTEFTSDARIELQIIDEAGGRETVSGAALIASLRSDAVHNQVQEAIGDSAERVDWRVNQEEDAESLHLVIVSDDPVLSLTYAERWLEAAETTLSARSDTTDFLAVVQNRLLSVSQSRDDLEAEVSALEQQYRDTRDPAVRTEWDLRRMEIGGETTAMQTSINRHIDAQELIERAGPPDELSIRILEQPRQATSDRTTVAIIRDVILGAFLGLLLGVGVALLTAVLRPRLYTRADLESMGLTAIGPIPSELLPAEDLEDGENDRHAFASEVLVGSCGEGDGLSAQVANQMASAGADGFERKNLETRPIGSLHHPTAIDQSGRAYATVAAVRSGESTSVQLREVERSIRRAGGQLTCVVIVDARRQFWRRARHVG